MKTKSKRRIWSGTIILVDRPPMGKLPKDRKFLLKREIMEICERVAKKSGYGGVTISVPDVKIALR